MAERGVRAAMAGQRNERRRAGSGSGQDTPQVHGTVVVGPKPEQFIKSGVIPRCCHGELAELPGVLVEGEQGARAEQGTHLGPATQAMAI